MFYRGYSQVGEFCGRLFGRSPMLYHSPWVNGTWNIGCDIGCGHNCCDC